MDATARERNVGSLVASGSANSTRGAANNQIKWGHLSLTSGAVAAVQTDWYEFMYSFGDRTGDGIISQTNPEGLNARLYLKKERMFISQEGRKSQPSTLQVIWGSFMI